ncbi:hypothetical protein ACFQX7_01325 [Luedemannella flava]
MTAGNVARGRQRLAAALDLAPAGGAHAELRWRLGMLTHLDGDTDSAVSILEAALVDAADDPPMQATVERKLAGLYRLQGRMSRSLEVADNALRWARAAGGKNVLLESLTAYAGTILLLDGAIPAPMWHQLDQLARGAAVTAAHHDPDGFLAVADYTVGNPVNAVARLERVLGRAVAHGDELGQIWAASYLAHAELVAGRWQQARSLATDALDRARRLPSVLQLGSALHAAALVEAHFGEADTARTHIAEHLSMLADSGLRYPACWARSISGFLLQPRRPAGRARGARPAHPRTARHGHPGRRATAPRLVRHRRDGGTGRSRRSRRAGRGAA